MAKASDVYERVTADLIAAVENGASGDDWSAPWHHGHGLPSNASTGAAYRGGNVVALWGATLRSGYSGQWWATYKQWRALGRFVRRGETATYGIKWTEPRARPNDDDGTASGRRPSRRLVPFGFAVFHYDQTDADEMAPECWEPPASSGPAPVAECEAFFERIGADVAHGGDVAGYSPDLDRIIVPARDAFRDASAYYATLAHEHCHWTGHRSRLARDASGDFGSDTYAAEELVAEMGAAFVAATLGIETEPRADPACYLACWLRVLRADPKALFHAATAAQRAADYLVERGATHAIAA